MIWTIILRFIIADISQEGRKVFYFGVKERLHLMLKSMFVTLLTDKGGSEESSLTKSSSEAK
ncbi:hypothetical protein C2G38_2024878, partial [Gigaspora rosea]